MRRDSWRHLAIEGWVFVLIAVIAFVGGLLIGELGGSTTTKTVYVQAPSETKTEPEATEEPSAATPSGKQLFTSIGCSSCHTLSAAGASGTIGPDLEESLATDDNTAGIEEMIIHPNAEVIEGYPPSVMPQDYGESLSSAEIHALAAFLVASTPAKP